MDGNGRWAQARGKPRLFGHHAGAKRVREIVEACPDLGVKYLTIFAFSTENWKRTQTEVAGLMSLFRRYIAKEARALFKDGVRVRFIGDRIKLDDKLVALMDELELLTSEQRQGASDHRAELRRPRRGGAGDQAAGARGQGRAARPRNGRCRDAGQISRHLCAARPRSGDPHQRARRGSRTSCSGSRPMPNTNSSTRSGPISRPRSLPGSSPSYGQRERRFGAVPG